MQNFHKNILIIPNCSSNPQKPVPDFQIFFYHSFVFKYAFSLGKIEIRNYLVTCLYRIESVWKEQDISGALTVSWVLPFDHELEKFQLKKVYYFIALSLFVLSPFFPSAFMNWSVLGRKV